MKSLFLRSVAIALLAFLLGCIVDEGVQVETRLGLDALFQLRGLRHPPDDVVIVTIDEYSDAEYDIGTDFTRWRGKHAQLIKALHEQAVKLIVFDLYFSDAQDDVDPLLAQAMTDAGNVLAVDCVQTAKNGWGLCGKKPKATQPVQVYPPIKPLDDALSAHAPFFLGDDAGNYVVRQSWSFLDDKPTLPVLAWFHWLDQNKSLLDIAPHNRLLADWIAEKRKQCLPQHFKETLNNWIPFMVRPYDKLRAHHERNQLVAVRPEPVLSEVEGLVEGHNHSFFNLNKTKNSAIENQINNLICGGDTRFIDYYGPPKTLRMVSYSDVREGRVKNLNDKIVFVGQVPRKNLPGVDSFVAPFTDTDTGKMAGVEVMATHFANLLEGREINPLLPPGLVMLSFGILISIVLTQFAGLIGMAGCVILSVGYLTLAVGCFKEYGMWLPVAVPLLLQLPVTLFIALYWSRLDQLAETKRLKAIIAQVTDENNRLINQFLEQLHHNNPLTLSLQGVEISEKVFGVCLVSDIEGFTKIAEKTPLDELIAGLREYFKVLGEIVSAYGGKIANIAGDGMVAIWADPIVSNQEQSACMASLRMRLAVDRLNSSLDNQHLLTRFGLHEGEFIIGKVMAEFAEDNPFGDVINTASRIEGVNKVLGTRILASASIAENLSNLMLRPVGDFLLLGKHQPIELVEIVSSQTELDKTVNALHKQFAKGLKAFRKGHWKQALALFKRLQEKHGYDGPTRYYLENFGNQDKPPPDWKGYIKLVTK